MNLINRRTMLAAMCAAAAVADSAHAAFSVDGPARARPGAVKGALLDLTVCGQRVVAVGERGHVLLSDDQGKTWRQARSVPTRSALTCIHATDSLRIWAAGHGGVILRSEDAGETWQIAAGKAEGTDVLLSVRVDVDGRGLAVGSYGLALVTADGGQSWARTTLMDGEAGEKHLNRIFVSKTGTWLIAAEGGQVLRGATRQRWIAVSTPYKGSLWTGLQLPDGAMLAGGMRGNIVRTTDDGVTWQHHAVPQAGSLTSAAVLSDGRAVLVGVDGTIVLGGRDGASFELRRQDDRTTLTGVVASGAGVIVSTTVGPRAFAI